MWYFRNPGARLADRRLEVNRTSLQAKTGDGKCGGFTVANGEVRAQAAKIRKG
jgi:hypothetical protein